MAAEAARGCGYRKFGNLYLVAGGFSVPCDRLPVAITVCPCCGAGIKQTRGWTWIRPAMLFKPHDEELYDQNKLENGGCQCPQFCPACNPENVTDVFNPEGKAGLLWVGEAFYSTPQDFLNEGLAQGISRRIQTIPKEFRLGSTWVFLAHKSAIPGAPPEGILIEDEGEDKEPPKATPGLFAVFCPQRIERIVKESELRHYKHIWAGIMAEAASGAKLYDLVEESDEIFWRLQRDAERGITLVGLPDDDPDHQPRRKK